METEIKYVTYVAIGFIVICIAIYFLTRKKLTDTHQESVVISGTLKKRFHYNKILLYIIGAYRLLELLYVIKSNESEQEFYKQLVIQGVLAIHSMIIGLLAIISSIAGIFLSLSYMRKEKDIAKKLLTVSLALLVVSLFWNYIINFLIALFT